MVSIYALDIKLNLFIFAGAYKVRSARPYIIYTILVKTYESQIGFYLKFIYLFFSTKGIKINLILKYVIHSTNFSLYLLGFRLDLSYSEYGTSLIFLTIFYLSLAFYLN